MRRTMRVDFIKMHGLGNDFVVLDARTRTLPAIDAPVARALADRRTGIGCDQLILLEPSKSALAACKTLASRQSGRDRHRP